MLQEMLCNSVIQDGQWKGNQAQAHFHENKIGMRPLKWWLQVGWCGGAGGGGGEWRVMWDEVLHGPEVHVHR